ncbi:NAD-dependent succinate-semialdehyde dehydrogenase [Mesobacillus harenae]|uniref:NAD-dependent succinate-semialdehyde dehydrogenase n=1 Tax=Mesobacillus harenae TaxID=2213203 RepID=UPI001580AE1B|nr:NAD-dependent succinate-semialdehyde dehydrogenase [Mesobacillus harenae]
MEGKLYINGEWIGDELEKINVFNPATGELIGKVPNGGQSETKFAIDSAYQSFSSWSKTTAYERSGFLKELYRLMLTHKNLLAELITLEMGKPLQEALGEVVYAASFLEWYAEEAKRVYGQTIPASHGNKRMMVLKQPIGVVAAITPWNFPAAMLTRKIGPALAAGCTVVVKPSELTPLTAMKITELAHQAGFPKGVINLVTGNPTAIGNEVMNNPKVRKVTFTGSTKVGKLLMAQGANQVKKLSLELGGHAPIIILNDAEINKAITGVMASKFRNAGQTCICGNRIYVQSGIYDKFVEKLVEETAKLKIGNGMEAGIDIGPLINQAAVDKVNMQVNNAIDNGAQCLLGGKQNDSFNPNYYPPTILTNVTQEMIIMNEETFGPVAPIQKFETDQEAIHCANDTPSGLAAYVFTDNLTKGMKFVESLDYGIIGWNDGAPSAAQAPFGGMKESGIGREGGQQGLEGFLETKYVSIQL